MKNKKYYIKLIVKYFQNVLKYVQLNLLEIDNVVVCHKVVLSFGGILI